MPRVVSLQYFRLSVAELRLGALAAREALGLLLSIGAMLLISLGVIHHDEHIIVVIAHSPTSARARWSRPSARPR